MSLVVEAQSEFAHGDQIVVHGMSSSLGLNGAKGSIVKKGTDASYWVVELENGRGRKVLPASNLANARQPGYPAPVTPQDMARRSGVAHGVGTDGSTHVFQVGPVVIQGAQPNARHLRPSTPHISHQPTPSPQRSAVATPVGGPRPGGSVLIVPAGPSVNVVGSSVTVVDGSPLNVAGGSVTVAGGSVTVSAGSSVNVVVSRTGSPRDAGNAPRYRMTTTLPVPTTAPRSFGASLCVSAAESQSVDVDDVDVHCTLRAGAKIMVTGLAQSGLHGVQGEVIKKAPEPDFWVVQLNNGVGRKSLHTQNLIDLSGHGSGETTPARTSTAAPRISTAGPYVRVRPPSGIAQAVSYCRPDAYLKTPSPRPGASASCDQLPIVDSIEAARIPQLYVGCDIVVSGHDTFVINGSKGKVVDKAVEPDCWVVQLDGSGRRSIHARNLLRLSHPGQPASTAPVAGASVSFAPVDGAAACKQECAMPTPTTRSSSGSQASSVHHPNPQEAHQNGQFTGDEFETGAFVVTAGFEYATEWNGLRGRIVKRSKGEADFWVVDLERGLGRKVFHTMNLLEAMQIHGRRSVSVRHRALSPPMPWAGRSSMHRAASSSPMRRMTVAGTGPQRPSGGSVEVGAAGSTTPSAPPSLRRCTMPAGGARSPPTSGASSQKRLPGRHSTEGTPGGVRNSSPRLSVPASAFSNTPTRLSKASGRPIDSDGEDSDRVDTAEIVAYDDNGRPIIVRQIIKDTGALQTVVFGDRMKIYGENTVKSLVRSSQGNTQNFVGKLTLLEVRGLCYELGQRLVEQSQMYHARVKELNILNQKNGFAYFGLTEGASKKELERAYRALAKKMHPDKNGGTEEAKRRFQQMKERYEALKKLIRDRDGAKDGDEDDDDDDAGEGGGQIMDGEAPADQPKREEAYEEDDVEDECPVPDDEELAYKSYDNKDRDSMLKYLWETIETLRMIKPQQEKLAKELHRMKQQDL